MNKPLILSLVRHIATAFGASLTAKGLTDDATVEAVIGGIIALVGFFLGRGEKTPPAATAAVLVIIGVAGSGCMNTASVVKAMGESNASLSVRIRSVYGTVEVVRLNPSTNTPPHSLSADGTLSVK